MRGKRKRFYQSSEQITWKFAVFVVFLSLFLIFLICSNIKVFQDKKALNSILSDLSQNINQILQAEQAQQGDRAKMEGAGSLEKTAREELNLQKPGEKVVAFPLVDNSTTSHKIDIESQSFFQWIIKKIK